MEVKDDGSTDIAVLEGKVEVEPLKDGKPTGKPPLVVNPGQRDDSFDRRCAQPPDRPQPVDTIRRFWEGPCSLASPGACQAWCALENFLDSSVPGALSSTVSYTSDISEVDACNQAQYLMPVNSKVDRFAV